MAMLPESRQQHSGFRLPFRCARSEQAYEDRGYKRMFSSKTQIHGIVAMRFYSETGIGRNFSIAVVSNTLSFGLCNSGSDG